VALVQAVLSQNAEQILKVILHSRLNRRNSNPTLLAHPALASSQLHAEASLLLGLNPKWGK
jgi:hypothetical protein